MQPSMSSFLRGFISTTFFFSGPGHGRFQVVCARVCERPGKYQPLLVSSTESTIGCLSFVTITCDHWHIFTLPLTVPVVRLVRLHSYHWTSLILYDCMCCAVEHGTVLFTTEPPSYTVLIKLPSRTSDLSRKY